MLARVIRNNGSGKVSIDWPNADGSSGSYTGPVATLSNRGGDPAGTMSELTAELMSLRVEITRLQGEIVQKSHEAYAAGKAEAEKTVRHAMEQQLEAETSKLRALMKEVRGSAAKLRRETEEELVRLAVAVARRIVHRELTVDPHALSGLIKVAFEKLDQREVQQIRTDQGSLEVVKKIASEIGSPGAIRVVADPTLRGGSLLIDFPKGQLDASVETQLDEIERGFVDIVRRS